MICARVIRNARSPTLVAPWLQTIAVVIPCWLVLMSPLSSQATAQPSPGEPDRGFPAVKLPESTLDDPFGDGRPGLYQQPSPPPFPGQAPCLPSIGPAFTAEPVPTQCPPAPATLSDLLFGDGRQTPRDYRSGSFQKLSFVNTYLPRMGANGFGTYDVELTSVWGLPCPTKDAPLVITPGIATYWLNGPANLDIPAQLHDVYTEFRWLPKIGERFRADFAIQPGFYSDWDGSSARALRFTGHLSGIYDWTPTFQLVLGAAYLDRPDVEVLPIAGFIWKPDLDTEYRLVFPTPKISWCLMTDGLDPTTRRLDNAMAHRSGSSWTSELWLYLAGELGGGTWAIRHSDGTSDLMSYGDWRVFSGIETRVIGGLSSQIEVGYVFHRLIRLSSTGENTQVGNTAMVRAALNY